MLEDIKEKIKMFNFTLTDFKGLFKGRVTKKQETAKRKSDEKAGS